LNVIFRTDASLLIGSGHVVRCLTLAQELNDKGLVSEFVCRDHDGNLINHITDRGFKVHILPTLTENNGPEGDLPHANWLGVHWKVDAEQTFNLLLSSTFDLLVVDHYGIDHRWEAAMKPLCNRIMVIDDLADRKHDCNLLLDQNLGKSRESYRGLIPKQSECFFGPEFALLKPAYAEQRKKMAPRDGQIKRALIYFGGGSDAIELTHSALKAFNCPELIDIQLDIVLSELGKSDLFLKKLFAERGKIALHKQLPDLASLMVKADIAIGACGSTTWERCVLGLPSILVACAINQEAISKAVHDAGAGIVLLPGEDLCSQISKAVIKLKSDKGHYRKISERAAKICDGSGAPKISSILIDNKHG